MTVRYEVDGAVVTVTIDRPEVRNAVDSATAAELVECFGRFDADESLNVAVLTGADGTFCSGYDLKELAANPPLPQTGEGDGPMGPTRMQLGKPVIAAVEGYAVAGGLELALWCDFRVAARDAVFGVFNRRFGVPLIDLGTVRLPRLIGLSHALDMILTGRGVRADEAGRMGLANRVVPSGQARASATALARDIASFPQAALRNDRLSSYEQWSLDVPDALALEYRYGMATLGTGEMAGGLDRYASGDWRQGTF